MTTNQEAGNADTVPSRISAQETADRLTEERGNIYGDPLTNLTCIAELKEVYRRYVRNNPKRNFNAPQYRAHDEAIEAVLMKVGRIATGSPCLDNYDDVMGYAKIAKDVVPIG